MCALTQVRRFPPTAASHNLLAFTIGRGSGHLSRLFYGAVILASHFRSFRLPEMRNSLFLGLKSQRCVRIIFS